MFMILLRENGSSPIVTNTHCFSDDTFKCNDCGQGFKSKVYLNKHRKSVHTVNEHDCPHCAMKFFNTTKFEYHLKSHDENKSKFTLMWKSPVHTYL